MSAEEIKSLSKLPLELQEEFLKEMSESGNGDDDRDVNIEIDGTIYVVPMAVSHLIDSLVFQIGEMYEIRHNKGN
jgi:hypothetical protein